MFAELDIKGSTLKSVLSDMATLIPSGSKTVPLGIDLSKGVLTFTCNGQCNCEETVKVNSDESFSITVVYSSISDLIPSGEQVKLTLQDSGMSIETSRISRFFRMAYSVVPKLEYTLPTMREIPGVNAVQRLRALTKTQLANMYNREASIEIRNEVAIMKYPNLWMQVRVPGFPCNCTLTQECARTLMTFGPRAFGELSHDTLVFKRDNALLFVPIGLCSDSQAIGSLLLEDMHITRLPVGKFVDNLKMLRSLGCKTARVSMLSMGLTVHGDCTDGSVDVYLGDKESDYLCSVELPTELLLLAVGLFTDTTAEFLYKEGILCLRNQDTAIVLRVLL